MAFAANKDAVTELDVLWITAGLGCDGDTIAMTAATQPSLEDVVLGQIPWIPKINLHNPFLASANGDDFLKPFYEAADGTAVRVAQAGGNLKTPTKSWSAFSPSSRSDFSLECAMPPIPTTSLRLPPSSVISETACGRP
ncbi:MAG: hypothetical protein WB660_12915 [Candidatus Sulfotelmatobacter sp.]